MISSLKLKRTEAHLDKGDSRDMCSKVMSLELRKTLGLKKNILGLIRTLLVIDIMGKVFSYTIGIGIRYKSLKICIDHKYVSVL